MNDLGILFGMEGRYDIAINYFEMALQQDPDNTSFLYNQAIAYDRMGDTEKAKERLLRILEIDPSNIKAAKRLEGYRRNQ
jgi:tetratricopeptide (TPR) repeat protein